MTLVFARANRKPRSSEKYCFVVSRVTAIVVSRVTASVVSRVTASVVSRVAASVVSRVRAIAEKKPWLQKTVTYVSVYTTSSQK